ADLYLHAARADTFPLAVLEALACGTPVVATAVGGVPEQITPATGVLVPKGDAAGMAAAVEALLRDDEARARLGANALADVAARFTVDRQVEAYLNWYREIAG
ncbi:MAG: glycosyltransferase, partial [Vicinamibacterales bacterium]